MSHETEVLKIFDFCAFYKIIISSQKMQKTKKIGRPKKATSDRENFGISAYFTNAEYLELQRIAKKRQYKSLSKLIKDTVKIGLKGNSEIERSIELEKESYRSYVAALIGGIDEMLTQVHNLSMPAETQKSIGEMLDTIYKLESRINR
ncbi:hypothetical protein [Pseudomonas putida]|uniref:hypothetical protein n=1 Tax=Pseudomonas putida TaxID=303 RepID=UPI0012D4A45E|nr:hypothetical protein [Pseudomonas putida]